MRTTRRTAFAAAAAAAALVGIAGAAYAAIPDSNGVIHGCYANSDGSLRVIDSGAGQSCKAKKETALDWNQSGPQGPAGPQGPQGPAGPGAQTFTATAPMNSVTTVATLGIGVVLRGECSPEPRPIYELDAVAADGSVVLAGVLGASGTSQQPLTWDTGASSQQLLFGGTGNGAYVDFEGLVREPSTGKFDFVDLHGEFNRVCSFWGMVVPS